MLNKFIDNYFKEYPQSQPILDTYNQFIDNMAEIIQAFKFEYTYKNRYSEIITIRFNFKDKSDQIEQVNKQQLLDAYQCRDRQSDLMQSFVFGINFEIILHQQNSIKTKIIDTDCLFNFQIPILSLTSKDIVNQMTDLEKWQNGISINTIGGDLILAGVKYILPNLFSFPFNKPIVVTADKNKQVVRAEYIRQINPVFGNSYYTSYHIVVDKNKYPDIVVYLKQNHDQRFNKDNKKNTPIYVPILLLFYVYGIENDTQFLNITNKYNEESFHLFLINCLRQGEFHKKLFKQFPNFRENPKEILAKYILIPDYYNHITQILEKYVHPINDKFFIILQDIIYKMYRVYLDPSEQFNKDSLQNKRVKTVSEQVVEQLRSRMNENYKSEMLSLERDKLNTINFENIESIKKDLENAAQNYSIKITKTMKRSFTSPNSAIQSSSLRKVQNEYHTLNYDLIQKREIVVRSEGKGQTTWHQRKVQNTYFGIIDTVQTPEAGSNVGRYNSPTLYIRQTIGQTQDEVCQYLLQHKLFLQKIQQHVMYVKINYITFGFVKWENFKELYLDLLKWRKTDISVCYYIEHQELNILTDMGRLIFPLINKISNIKELNEVPIKELIKQQKIIFVCAEMLNNFVINQSNDISTEYGLNPSKYYLFPYGTLSPITATNPFINHMKSVRASYSCPQQKQGVTCPNTNFMNLMSNSQLILHKLQHSPIQTLIGNTVYKHIPIGNLLTVAIMEYCTNQEDAIVASQGYFMRGGLQVSEYNTVQTILQSNKNMFIIQKDILDDLEKNPTTSKYRLLNTEYCIPDKIGLLVQQNDVLTASTKLSNSGEISAANNVFQSDINSKFTVISNVNTLYLNKSQTSRMTRIQISRITNVGDKFISRNAQKGTIGEIIPEWNLPIDLNGIIPNFLTSSNSILKRETYGQIMEVVLNKYLCRTQQYKIQFGLDERFENTNLISDLEKIEAEQLIQPDGNLVKNKITMGPITYIPYCHLVEDKVRARNDGEIDQITKQPVSGKKNDGGLKLGTLDVIAYFSQGISNTVKHQFGQNSSNCQWYWCGHCKTLTVYKDRISQEFICTKCQKADVKYGSFNYGLKFYDDVMFSIGCQLQLK